MEIIKLSQRAVNEAVKIIKNGGVVICPTDTVYGFLADAGNKKAVSRIFKIKKRQKAKPLPVFVKDIEMAKNIAFIDNKQEKILEKHWPGKTTFVLKKKNKGTIALRIPKYKFLNDLLKKINKPLTQTSVNISGQPALNNIKEIINQFGDKVDLIIDAGNLPKRKPSSIIDLTKNKIILLRK